MVKVLRDVTAREVSDLSHEFIGWQAAIKEASVTGVRVSIPYGTVHVSNPVVSHQELRDALEMSKKYEWPI